MNLGPSFASPWALGLLLLLPLLAWLRWRGGVRGALLVSGFGTAAPDGLWRLHLPYALRLLALACLIIALARPQLGFAREERLTEGIDIQIALDVSGSMAAEDFQPRNRLEVAKGVVREFIDQRDGDRVGVIAFAGEALTKAPLTTDYRMLRLLVDSIALHTLPDGTAIGQALATAAARLKDSQVETQIIVLVTDGDNNRGVIDPESAAAVAEGLGIKVYTVGVGTDGVVSVPTRVVDVFGREKIQRQNLEVRLDEDLLRSIADRTGGRYFRATDPESLRDIFQEINTLETTPLQVRRSVRYKEAFQPFALTGLGLLLLPLVLTTAGLGVEP